MATTTRYQVSRTRGSWAVVDTRTGAVRPGMVYAGARQLADHLNRAA